MTAITQEPPVTSEETGGWSANGVTYKAISADSHVTEPPNCYVDYIEPGFRDRAPYVTRPSNEDVWILEGAEKPIKMGTVACAGRDPAELNVKYLTYPELHEGGWDAKARLIAQDEDGVAGEVIYPTIGMLVSQIVDLDLQNACMNAYNRWLQEFCAGAPDRLFGIGQTALRTVEEGVRDLEEIKRLGFRGAMLPGETNTEFDYDDPRYDPLWRASIELALPISFHILAGRKKDPLTGAHIPLRGHPINIWPNSMRQNQDIIGMLIFSGVLDRHPQLRVVCVEADAGWAPHFSGRMDHMYGRYRLMLKAPNISRMPSEFFNENIYLTFQDDRSAYDAVNRIGAARLMWANDYPHADSTWPHSQSILREQTIDLTEQQRKMILCDNVKQLYGIR